MTETYGWGKKPFSSIVQWRDERALVQVSKSIKCTIFGVKLV
jgi:hypothetical protein